ncbi:hypothetical protein GA0070618_4450 [Micromonospora echinospora]|uniref:Uncharacterized protein n=1 Tax=Micromonospora echinospora TaxID=1877 RepID=A0A1C4YVV4_MICEC|nr:hypothetical protein GA0070618_4450 [Micromonospora echinospora]
MVAWWADLVTYVLLAAVAGEPVAAYRAAAADPSAIPDVEEPRRLPYPIEEARRFAELGAAVAGTPGPNPATDEDLYSAMADYVARVRLALRPSPTGGLVVVDDLTRTMADWECRVVVLVDCIFRGTLRNCSFSARPPEDYRTLLGGVFKGSWGRMMQRVGRRYELSDVEWEALSRYLPSAVTGGRPRVDDRRVQGSSTWRPQRS